MDYLTLVSNVVGSLAWPTSIVVISLVLKAPISILLDRINVFKYGEAKVEFLQNEKGKTIEESSKNPIKSDIKIDEKLFPAIMEEKDRISVVVSQIKGGGNEDIEDTLKYFLAQANFLHWCEKQYNIIFGSQVALLKAIKENGKAAEEEIFEHYTNTCHKHPELYKDFNKDLYLRYLFQCGMIVIKDNNEYVLTNLGTSFISWININYPMAHRRYG